MADEDEKEEFDMYKVTIDFDPKVRIDKSRTGTAGSTTATGLYPATLKVNLIFWSSVIISITVPQKAGLTARKRKFFLYPYLPDGIYRYNVNPSTAIDTTAVAAYL